eukprot:1155839-Pelagomonas_calceolata.AAC.9
MTHPCATVRNKNISKVPTVAFKRCCCHSGRGTALLLFLVTACIVAASIAIATTTCIVVAAAAAPGAGASETASHLLLLTLHLKARLPFSFERLTMLCFQGMSAGIPLLQSFLFLMCAENLQFGGTRRLCFVSMFLPCLSPHLSACRHFLFTPCKHIVWMHISSGPVCCLAGCMRQHHKPLSDRLSSSLTCITLHHSCGLMGSMTQLAKGGPMLSRLLRASYSSCSPEFGIQSIYPNVLHHLQRAAADTATFRRVHDHPGFHPYRVILGDVSGCAWALGACKMCVEVQSRVFLESMSATMFVCECEEGAQLITINNTLLGKQTIFEHVPVPLTKDRQHAPEQHLNVVVHDVQNNL